MIEMNWDKLIVDECCCEVTISGLIGDNEVHWRFNVDDCSARLSLNYFIQIKNRHFSLKITAKLTDLGNLGGRTGGKANVLLVGIGIYWNLFSKWNVCLNKRRTQRNEFVSCRQEQNSVFVKDWKENRIKIFDFFWNQLKIWNNNK